MAKLYDSTEALSTRRDEPVSKEMSFDATGAEAAQGDGPKDNHILQLLEIAGMHPEQSSSHDVLEATNAMASPTFAGGRGVKAGTTFSGEMNDTQGTTTQSAALPHGANDSLLQHASTEHPQTEPKSSMEKPLQDMIRTG